MPDSSLKPSALPARTDLSQIPLAHLKGIGPVLLRKFARLQVQTVLDLLLHLPVRYEDRSRLVPIGRLTPGDRCKIIGQVIEFRIEPGRRPTAVVVLQDDSGRLALRFFAPPAALRARLQPGVTLSVFGQVRAGRGIEMIHPDWEILTGSSSAIPGQPLVFAGASEPVRLSPVYPATEGLSQGVLRRCMDQALAMLNRNGLPEFLPERLLRANARLTRVSAVEALNLLHSPDVDALATGEVDAARRRLVLEELVAHRWGMLSVREELRGCLAPACRAAHALEQALLARIPFALTAAQTRVIAEIRRDMAGSRPMLRLLQGDVGAGKTLVAVFAMLDALESGYQCALMAPTELLAEQHARSLEQWLNPLGFEVALLSGRLPAARARGVREQLREGTLQVAAGTQALIQDSVQFARLGLIVIDEQHRFGVQQRLQLQEKGSDGLTRLPHQLVMTATPIPRTLAMSAYADLDTSVLDELPPGRTPIKTSVVSDSRRQEVLARIREVCREGAQVYWVCTLVEASEVLESQAAEDVAAELAETLQGVSVGLVHGRLATSVKSEVMEAFRRNEIQLLVATTVIEVGVDVPNASLMVIENPERLGLAQIHQLRGRVGRGCKQSYCLLMYHPPLSVPARARLQALRDSQDGFWLAEQDLALRGAGEMLGTRQTGSVQFRIADLERDGDILSMLAEPELAEGNSQGDIERLDRLRTRWIGHREAFARA